MRRRKRKRWRITIITYIAHDAMRRLILLRGEGLSVDYSWNTHNTNS